MNKSVAGSTEPRFNPIPSLLTLCNAFCGFASIIYAITSYARGESTPAVCVWLLMGAMVFDALDGLVARRLNATSIHGAQLDSLSDAISFGVAPAVGIFVFIHQGSSETPIVMTFIWLAALFYLGCTLWRLARYNTMTVRNIKNDDCFQGLPSPAAACMIYSAGLLLPKMALGPHLFFSLSIGYATLAGLLMVSTIPYPHLRRCVAGKSNRLTVTFICVLLVSIILFRTTALIGWAYIYFLITPLIELWLKNPKTRPSPEPLFSSIEQ